MAVSIRCSGAAAPAYPVHTPCAGSVVSLVYFLDTLSRKCVMLTPAAARWLTAKNAGFTVTTRARAVARPNDE